MISLVHCYKKTITVCYTIISLNTVNNIQINGKLLSHVNRRV